MIIILNALMFINRIEYFINLTFEKKSQAIISKVFTSKAHKEDRLKLHIFILQKINKAVFVKQSMIVLHFFCFDELCSDGYCVT